MVVSYLFEKPKTIINQRSYHSVYINDSLFVLKGKKSVHEIKYWLAEFHNTVDKAEVNQQFQFTAEIWTNYTNVTPFTKEDNVTRVTNK